MAFFPARDDFASPRVHALEFSFVAHFYYQPTTVKNVHALILSISALLSSCVMFPSGIDHPDPGTPGIIVEKEETREHYWDKVVFPPGLYLPEAKSADGIYYAAPTPLYTGGVIRGGREHGGLFINHRGAQGMWVGQPGYQLKQAPGTVMGKRGVETPILRAIKTPVPFKTAPKR